MTHARGGELVHNLLDNVFFNSCPFAFNATISSDNFFLWKEKKKKRVTRVIEYWHCQGESGWEPRVVQPYNLHGSRAMKCAPRAGWIFVGFGVAISLLFAIFVLALANSKRRVWGLSGSKRIPWGRDAGGEEGGGHSIVRDVGWVWGGCSSVVSHGLLS